MNRPLRAPIDSEPQPPDVALVRAMARGEISPLGELYARHLDSIRHFLMRLTSHSSDVDDLVHETFLSAYRAAAGYDGRSSARPWLLGIAAGLARRRRRSLARAALAFAGFALEPKDAPPSPEHAAADAETLRAFDAALGRMTESKRVVFLLVESEGLSGEVVAELLGIPLGTVWTRLHYARTELRGALSKGGRS